VSFWDVVFGAEDGYASSYEAVCDAFSAVDMGSFHDDIFYLCVADGCVVSVVVASDDWVFSDVWM